MGDPPFSKVRIKSRRRLLGFWGVPTTEKKINSFSCQRFPNLILWSCCSSKWSLKICKELSLNLIVRRPDLVLGSIKFHRCPGTCCTWHFIMRVPLFQWMSDHFKPNNSPWRAPVTTVYGKVPYACYCALQLEIAILGFHQVFASQHVCNEAMQPREPGWLGYTLTWLLSLEICEVPHGFPG